MSKTSIRLIIFSSSFFLFSIAVVAAAIWYRESSGAELIHQLSSLQNQTAMEAAETSLLNLEKNIQDDQEYLDSLVLKDETETVELLSMIDGWAANNGVVVNTTNLHIEAEEKGNYDNLFIDLTFTGGEDAVQKMVMLMERLPYHSEIDQLNFKRLVTGNQTLAEAVLQLHVAIKKSK